MFERYCSGGVVLQVVAKVLIDRRRERRVDRGIGRIPVRASRDAAVQLVGLEAPVEASDHDVLRSRSSSRLKAVVGNADVRVANVLLGEAEIALSLRTTSSRSRAELLALRKRAEILAQREMLDVRARNAARSAGLFANLVVVPRGRGFGRQIKHVGPVASADRSPFAIVEPKLRIDDSRTTPLSAMPCCRATTEQRRRARRAVAFAKKKLRRVPAVELR